MADKESNPIRGNGANGAETAAMLQLFVTHAPVAMAMFDQEMRYLAWSQEWSAFYGLGARDLHGLCHYDVFPALPERWRVAHRRGLDGETIECAEDSWVLSDGREIWLRWSVRPIPDGAGGITGIALYTEDITARKQAEAELICGNARLQQISDSLGIGIFEHDFATGVSTVSDGYLRLLHIRRDEVPRTTEEWVALLRPVDLEAYRLARQRAMDPAGDGRFTAEIRPIVDGKERIMQVSSQVRFVGEGAERRPARLIGITTDQTEGRHLQDALSRAQRLETVGRLAGMVAHDFNNLLTVILSNLELADLRTTDAAVRHLLRQAADAAEIGAGFTKRLLVLAGGHKGSARTLVADEHLARVWELFERVLSDGIAFHFHPGAGEAMVSIDPAEIDGAVLNLVVNARDAQPTGGEVTLSTETVTIGPDQARTIPGGRAGRFLRLSVSDRGPGMTTEVAARAAEPFFSTKGASRGTGLGLTSVSLTAERAGGFVEIVSVLGQGTEVRLYLPQSEATQSSAKDDSDDYPFGHGELVLVVENDALLREAVMQRFEAIGYAVIEAANAQSALDLIAAGEPVDLVFSDVVMPGALSGHDLVRSLRQNHPGIALLLTSGHISEAYRDRQPLDPPVELLAKPYPLKSLARAAARALRRAHPPA